MMSEHIREGELLRAADGELSKDRTAQINEHLAACWICRTRLRDLEGAIGQFVHAHIGGFESRIPKIDGPRSLLRARIAEMEGAEKPSWWEAVRLPLQRWSIPLYSAITVIIIGVVSIPFIVHKAAPGITVAEVLSKAESGEQLGLREVKQPVTYQKVRIQVGGHVYDRSIYRDAKNARHVAKLDSIGDRMSEKEADRMLNPVERAFSEAKLDWEAPLSPSRLSGWRSALSLRADQVRSDRGITEIATATPDGPIAEAKVKFRNADFRAISETLRLRDDRVVEIAELDYKVLELNQLHADLFGAAPTPLFAVRTVGLEAAQANAGGLALELDVIGRLDRVDAFTGEQIAVERHRDVVHVQGVVDGKQRRDQIIAALGLAAKNPELQLDLVVPEGRPRRPTGSAHEAIEGIDEFQQAPADGSLRDFFAKKSPGGIEEEIQRFTDEVSLRSQSARANALALKQIAERFSPEDLRAMTPEQHRQWRGMLQSHAGAVLKETRLIQENLEPIFRANTEDKRSPGSNLKSDADLVYAAAKLSDLTISNDSAVWHSFAASTQASNVTLVCLPEFWESLLDAEILAEEISASTANGESRF